jgi:hypothetical protein
MEPVPANPIAARIRAEIDPYVRNWPENNRTQLLRFIEAWTQPLMVVEQYVRDVGDRPGYADVMHPDTAPSSFWSGTAQHGVRQSPRSPLRPRARPILCVLRLSRSRSVSC